MTWAGFGWHTTADSYRDGATNAVENHLRDAQQPLRGPATGAEHTKGTDVDLRTRIILRLLRMWGRTLETLVDSRVGGWIIDRFYSVRVGH
jgi:hypothetical protein